MYNHSNVLEFAQVKMVPIPEVASLQQPKHWIPLQNEEAHAGFFPLASRTRTSKYEEGGLAVEEIGQRSPCPVKDVVDHVHLRSWPYFYLSFSRVYDV